MDAIIKALTIVKLLIEVTFWGLMLGLTIWLFYHNPLPKLVEDLTTSMTKAITLQESQAVQGNLKGLLDKLPLK